MAVGKVNRGKELEDAARKYLDLKGYLYISAKSQTVKCLKCGQFQKVRTEGFDQFVYYPDVFVLEEKTGAGVLSPAQKRMKEKCERVGIPYLELKDNIDLLLKHCEGRA